MTDFFEGQVPIWKSTRVPTELLPVRQHTIENICTLVRWVDARAPLGLLFSRTGLWDEMAAKVEHLPSGEEVKLACYRQGTTIRDVLRLALGPEQALRRGRVRARTVAEFIFCMAEALEDGFEVGMGTRQWDDFARSRPYIPTWSTIALKARQAGLRGSELLDAATELRGRELGIETSEQAHRTASLRRRRIEETCSTAAELSWVAVDPETIHAWRKAGKVFAFKRPGFDSWMFPKWQFMTERRIHPVACEVLKSSLARDASFDELYEVT